MPNGEMKWQYSLRGLCNEVSVLYRKYVQCFMKIMWECICTFYIFKCAFELCDSLFVTLATYSVYDLNLITQTSWES